MKKRKRKRNKEKANANEHEREETHREGERLVREREERLTRDGKTKRARST
jgi:hypothetical protein